MSLSRTRPVFRVGILAGQASPMAFAGAGSPEGVVTGIIGDTFQRTDGATNTTFYVKESGTGTTGWVAQSSAIPAGSVVNASVSASAAIDGTKISPDFGAQTITTTGTVSAGTVSAASIGATDATINTIYADDVTITDVCTAGSASISGLCSAGSVSTSFAYLTNALIDNVSLTSATGPIALTGHATFTSGGATLYQFQSNGAVMWGKTIAAPSYYHEAQTTDVACTDTLWQSQTPWASATLTNRNPGNLGFVVPSPAAGGTAGRAFFTISGVECLSVESTGVSVTGLTVSGLTTGIAHLGSGGAVTSSEIVNADVAVAAAIAGTKISPAFGAQNISTTGSCAVGGLVCAGLTCASLTFAGGTTGILHSTGGSVTSSAIVDADVGAAAAIAGTKISPAFGTQNITNTGTIQATGNITSTGGNITSAGNYTAQGLGQGIVHCSNVGVFSSSSTITISGCTIRAGAGTPEGVVTAAMGSLFLRTDGGASTTLYVKTSGAGNTGWTAK
jgi:hypothetical protein